jgi:hypothetical protein
MTIARWLSMSAPKSAPLKRAKKMCAVRVVDAPSTVSTIIATTREGLRIEGLSVAELVTLLRGLG